MQQASEWADLRGNLLSAGAGLHWGLLKKDGLKFLYSIDPNQGLIFAALYYQDQLTIPLTDAGASKVSHRNAVSRKTFIACSNAAKLLAPNKKAVHQVAVFVYMSMIAIYMSPQDRSLYRAHIPYSLPLVVSKQFAGQHLGLQ